METKERRTVQSYLDGVDYEFNGYMPSDEALKFVNFIKAVNDGEEENSTPLVHLKMMDGVFNTDRRCAIMCHRGIAKRLPHYSKILTPSGWTTMGDIKVGDKVINRLGDITTVNFKSKSVKRPTYRIYLDDMSYFDADDEHNHIVRDLEGKEKVVTTYELLGEEYNYSIPLMLPIKNYSNKVDMCLYTLGFHLFEDRFVYEEFKDYLLVSYDDRIRLFHGLMDKFGTYDERREYTIFESRNNDLTRFIEDLARGLGAWVSSVKICDDLSDPINETVIKTLFNPFKDCVEVSLWKSNNITSRKIVSISRIHDTVGSCIQVESKDHSFITDNYTITSNTTLFAEYLILYIASFGIFPGFGKTNLMLYVTDSIENGVKNLRRNVEFRYEQSKFLQKMIPNKKIGVGTNGTGFVGLDEYETQTAGGRKFTDIRLEFQNIKGHTTVVKGYGAKSLTLDTVLYTPYGYTTIGDVKIGDDIYGPDGKLTCVITKSEIFHKPIYKLYLEDGRNLKVSIDHINSIVYKKNNRYVRENITTDVLLDMIKQNDIFIENTSPVEYPEIYESIPLYYLGISFAKGAKLEHISHLVNPLGSVDQRTELLEGILSNSFRGVGIYFYHEDHSVIELVCQLARSLGKSCYVKECDKNKVYITNSSMVKVTRIEKSELEPSQCIAVDNSLKQYLAGTTKSDYIRTHNTGVRGSKEMGQRPSVCVLDDLISDEDARSDTIIESIENTVYKAVSKALHPTKQKMVWLGTPFNTKDPLYKAVESGAWNVSVYPVCEKFPVTKAEFKGSWEDRFTYEYVKAEYEEAQLLGKPDNFDQELMLRIMSEEDRLLSKEDLDFWFDDSKIMENRNRYNFYITTDFATSAKKSADYSVISVWAYTSGGVWLLVDGICARQLMDRNIEDLFRLVNMYRPLSVGIEITGQQQGFISWIEQEMINRNIYFKLAGNGETKGIRPVADKLVRFNSILPLFKLSRIKFGKSLRYTSYGRELEDELFNVSKKGFKSKHDDVSDTISMLNDLNAYKPSEEVVFAKNSTNGIWSVIEDEEEIENNSYYIN